jgi:hypothetical protein
MSRPVSFEHPKIGESWHSGAIAALATHISKLSQYTANPQISSLVESDKAVLDKMGVLFEATFGVKLEGGLLSPLWPAMADLACTFYLDSLNTGAYFEVRAPYALSSVLEFPFSSFLIFTKPFQPVIFHTAAYLIPLRTII